MRGRPGKARGGERSSAMKSMAWTLVAACALVWGGTAAGALEAEEAAEATEAAEAVETVEAVDAAEGQAGEVAEEAGEAVEAEGAEEEALPDKVREEDEPKAKEEEGGARAAARAGAEDAAGWLAEAGVELDDEAAYAGALEGVLRAGDPRVRILSKGEWEAGVEAEKSASDEVAVEDLPGGFGYVKAGSLSWAAGEKVFEALKGWRDNGAAGVVLDLRGAGGAAGKTCFDENDERGVEPGTGDKVAGFFKDVGGILRRDGETTWGTERLYEGKNEAPPTMVLVDGETHGEAELLAAELKGSCRGTLLIGQETAGDPLVREPRELPDGRVALLPARRWTMEDGTVYDGRRGVVPDIELGDEDKTADAYEPKNPLTLRRNKRGELEEEKVDRALRERIGTDGFLRRAVDILLGLQAMGK